MRDWLVTLTFPENEFQDLITVFRSPDTLLERQVSVRHCDCAYFDTLLERQDTDRLCDCDCAYFEVC
jgi:hypothetical protein